MLQEMVAVRYFRTSLYKSEQVRVTLSAIQQRHVTIWDDAILTSTWPADHCLRAVAGKGRVSRPVEMS